MSNDEKEAEENTTQKKDGGFKVSDDKRRDVYDLEIENAQREARHKKVLRGI